MTVSAQDATRPGRRGRPRKLSPAEVDILVGIVRDTPLLSLDDTVWAFRRQTGITLSVATIQRYLAGAGVQRHQPSRAAVAAARSAVVAPVTPRTYGYHAAHRDPGDAVRYPCGLTDAEWAQAAPLFAPVGRTGRPERYPRREMLDACIYVLRSGCAWRMLPKNFPPWAAVYRTFRRWQAQGRFEALYDQLRQLWRTRQHRAPDPTAAVLDSQSVRTSPQGGPKGYDAAKKIKGRKRHLVTDTLGLLLAVVITAASMQDRDAALPTMDLAMQQVPGLQMLYVDGGYAGAQTHAIRQRHGLDVTVVRHPRNRNVGRWHEGQLSLLDLPTGFVVLPKRWVIERTNAWNDRPRRMNKDHDRHLAVSAAWIWLPEARMLLRRVTTETPDLTT